MPSALDTFRAQREAANGVYERLQEISALLGQLGTQVEALARSDELKRMLEREETWLTEARRTVVEVRRWREREAQRFWSSVVAHWLVAAVFAIASAVAAGGGYGWATKPYAAELNALRNRQEFVDYIERRIVAMTPAERRQFDVLMRSAGVTKR